MPRSNFLSRVADQAASLNVRQGRSTDTHRKRLALVVAEAYMGAVGSDGDANTIARLLVQACILEHQIFEALRGYDLVSDPLPRESRKHTDGFDSLALSHPIPRADLREPSPLAREAAAILLKHAGITTTPTEKEETDVNESCRVSDYRVAVPVPQGRARQADALDDGRRTPLHPRRPIGLLPRTERGGLAQETRAGVRRITDGGRVTPKGLRSLSSVVE